MSQRASRMLDCTESLWGKALAECDERGEALPLAAKEMSRLFPSLWSTRMAAEHWTAKNPQETSNSAIRVWGVCRNGRTRVLCGTGFLFARIFL